MMRRVLVSLAVLTVLGLIAWYVSANTHWEWVRTWSRPGAQARNDPFYAQEKLLQQLGVRSRVAASSDALPATDEVLVLQYWNWELTVSLRKRIERWVESGGRLIVDRSLTTTPEFERWSGLVLIAVPERRQADADEESDPDTDTDSGSDNKSADQAEAGGEDGAATFFAKEHCDVLRAESVKGEPTGPGTWKICDGPARFSYWRDVTGVSWSLASESGSQLRRQRVGRGSVTGINSWPWHLRQLFAGDHPQLFAMAMQLRQGDSVVFLRGDRSPGLTELMWRHGAPVLVLLAFALVLGLWRLMTRFGPMQQPAPAARRSLREQIAGTTAFLRREGAAIELWRASVLALDAELLRHLPLTLPLDASTRLHALNRLTGMPPQRLEEALSAQQDWRPDRIARAVTQLENLRRRLHDPAFRPKDVNT